VKGQTKSECLPLFFKLPATAVSGGSKRKRCDIRPESRSATEIVYAAACVRHNDYLGDDWLGLAELMLESILQLPILLSTLVA
jgi:hypothetical protein